MIVAMVQIHRKKNLSTYQRLSSLAEIQRSRVGNNPLRPSDIAQFSRPNTPNFTSKGAARPFRHLRTNAID
jgi:hypothetical protein